MSNKAALLLALSLVHCNTLHAQTRLGVYGTVGGESSGFQNQPWTPAGTFGLYYVLGDANVVSLSLDGRGDISGDLRSVLFGPRIAFRVPVFALKPYGEFLVGRINYSSRNDGRFDASDIAYRYVGGLDITALPHIDFRIVDFSYGGGASEIQRTIHQKTISTGVVVRF